MISKFIIKTNEWYESLSSIKGGLFYMGLIFIPYSILIFTLPSPYYLSLPLVWIFIVALWRLVYSYILDYRNIKNTKDK